MHPTGTFYGFRTLLDAKKRVRFRPLEPVWIFPSKLELANAELGSIGYFMGYKQAAFPDQKWEFIKPVPVFDRTGKKANFDPMQTGETIRFITTKKIVIPPKQCFKLR